MWKFLAGACLTVLIYGMSVCGTNVCICADEPKANDVLDQAGQAKQAGQAVPDRVVPDQAVQDKNVLDFVSQHQPELAELIVFLKKKQPADYRQAIRENLKVRDRLVQLEERDPELYAVELNIWKNAAQLRLWAASVSVKSKKLSDEDRAQLKRLVAKENELIVQRLTLDKQRAEARIAQLNQQLSKRQAQSESVVAKGVKTWENRIERTANAANKKRNNSP
ncbi:MAG: hypothetical protein IT423_22675 [Pirellulaceae bacterium]|nr:hypothetical protein [Pirellulaceae bacterium]